MIELHVVLALSISNTYQKTKISCFELLLLLTVPVVTDATARPVTRAASAPPVRMIEATPRTAATATKTSAKIDLSFEAHGLTLYPVARVKIRDR